MSNIYIRDCVSEDYESYIPTDAYGNQCILGQQISYTRRIVQAQCYANYTDFPSQIISTCPCTDLDFRCGQCYYRSPFYASSPSETQNCYWICNSTNPNPPPVPCDNVYNATQTPFIKNTGSQCVGGTDLVNGLVQLQCPNPATTLSPSTTNSDLLSDQNTLLLNYILTTVILVVILVIFGILMFLNRFKWDNRFN